MGEFGIILDSTVYMPKAILEDNNIEVVSLNITVENEDTYKEADISREFIIEKRQEGKTFKTSAPCPGLFHEAYQKLLQTNQHIFVIGLSKELSGTYQSSVVGRTMLDDPKTVTVFDTNQSAYGNEMLVYELLEMIKSEKSVSEITERINKLIKQSKLLFTCENLFSLVAGGRLSTAKAMIGTILRMKPVIEMIDGKLILIKTERTYSKIFKIIKDKVDETSKGFDKLSFYITSTYSDKSSEALKTFIQEAFPNSSIRVTELLGPIMTVHVGNKGFGISWFYE